MQNETKETKHSTEFLFVLKLLFSSAPNNVQALNILKFFTGMVFRLWLLSNPTYKRSKDLDNGVQ